MPAAKQRRTRPDRGRPFDYFAFYPDDWLIGTSRMTAAAKGVYMDLLSHAWRKGPISADPKKLAELVPEIELPGIFEQVRNKFATTPDGMLVNERLERERSIVASISKYRSKAGAMGGKATAANARKSKAEMHPSSNGV